MGRTALIAISDPKHLYAVWKRSPGLRKKKSVGVDGITPAKFQSEIDKNIRELSRDIRSGEFQYDALRAVPVPKPDGKMRIICIPTVRDRIVQRALLETLTAQATRLRIANDVSYGFVSRPSGEKRGYSEARDAAKQARAKHPWAFKTDISAFFDSIPRSDLIAHLRNSFRPTTLMPLIEAAIQCEADDGQDDYVRQKLQDAGIKRGIGLRQGMPLSPLLSNVLLRDFDRSFIRREWRMIRYADDLIVLADTREQCAEIESSVLAELENLGLKASKHKTFTYAPDEPAEFLGLELARDASGSYRLRISDKQLEKVRDAYFQWCDFDRIASRHLTIARLFQKLEYMSAGYRTAYACAETESRHRLDGLIQEAPRLVAERIIRSTFGKDAIKNLTANQRAFLMLPGAEWLTSARQLR